MTALLVLGWQLHLCMFNHYEKPICHPVMPARIDEFECAFDMAEFKRPSPAMWLSCRSIVMMRGDE